MPPGITSWTTRIPSSSSASWSISPYALSAGNAIDVPAKSLRAFTDVPPLIRMMLPSPAVRIAGSTDRTAWMSPRTENRSASSASSGVISSTGLRYSREGRGLYCSTAMEPSSATARARATSRDAGFRTSAAYPRATAPPSWSWAASPSSFAWSREISATAKPSAPNLRATAAPRPGPAPMIAMVGMAVPYEKCVRSTLSPNTVQLGLQRCSLGVMPRAGWVKPESDRRLSDLVSVGVLTRVFPPGLVDEVIADAGRTEQRHRSLPARVMAYFSIGMALYSEGSYQDVLAQLTDGLSWASRWQDSYSPPSKSAIFQARVRLGSEPLAALFERVARPIGGEQAPGVWLAGRRLVAVDGTCLDVADTAVNAEHFGRPGVNKGERAAFPQARVVALAECGTHAVFAARVGPYGQSEATLTRSLLDQVAPGMLLLADRGFFSYALWRQAIGTGADLLSRVRTDRAGPKPVHLRDLPDGSWLAHLRRATPAAARREEPMLVRVIDYSINDGRENPTTYRLITTVTDPGEVSAVDLAATYAQRWEIELAFDELKTHQRGPRTVLRSKSPDLVRQEIWGHLCCHFAIRSLMVEAAHHCGHDPDRISFVAALRITRQTIAHPGAFPP